MFATQRIVADDVISTRLDYVPDLFNEFVPCTFRFDNSPFQGGNSLVPVLQLGIETVSFPFVVMRADKHGSPPTHAVIEDGAKRLTLFFW